MCWRCGTGALVVVLLSVLRLPPVSSITLRSLNPPHASGDPQRLPRLNIDPAAISVSGQSAGADFAVQFQVAFSQTVMGSAVFEGQPYRCAVARFPDDTLLSIDDPIECPSCFPHVGLFRADTMAPICEGCPDGMTLLLDHCKSPDPDVVDVRLLVDSLAQFVADGLIDDVEHLKGARIYFFQGSGDTIYLGNSTKNTMDFFAAHVPIGQLTINDRTPAGHCWPVNESQLAGDCGGMSGIQNCGVDGPGDALQHIYGQLAAPGIMSPSMLRQFQEMPYVGQNGSSAGFGLHTTGHIYVPQVCAEGKKCRLHVVFLGCNHHRMADTLMEELSFNQWAETNSMVVLWPKLVPYWSDGPAANHHGGGCWDAYGATGSDYAFKGGVQMAAVYRMIEAIVGSEKLPSV